MGCQLGILEADFTLTISFIQNNMDIGRQAISKNALENLIKTNRVEGPIGGQTTLQQGTIMQLCNSQPGSDVRQIREQNEHLRAMIASLNNTLNEPPQFEEKQAEAPQ